MCSVNERYKNFLPNILDILYPQCNNDSVELIVLYDNKRNTLSEKRNYLLNMAQGKYVTFVDDDDEVTTDYVSSLLEVINDKNGYSVINFVVSVSLNGGEYKPCYYSIEFEKDYNTDEAYYRLPNHIMCVKNALAKTVKYRNVKNEDSEYASRLKPLITKEYNINKTLYYYNFSSLITEAQ